MMDWSLVVKGSLDHRQHASTWC